MQLFEKAADAEALYTAAVLVLHEQYPETDICIFIKRLKYVLALDDGLVLIIIDSEDKNRAKTYLLPWKKNADALRDADSSCGQRMEKEMMRFVECLYRGNTDSEYKTIDEGFLTHTC